MFASSSPALTKVVELVFTRVMAKAVSLPRAQTARAPCANPEPSAWTSTVASRNADVGLREVTVKVGGGGGGGVVRPSPPPPHPLTHPAPRVTPSHVRRDSIEECDMSESFLVVDAWLQSPDTS